ncbi:MAG: undecaprenyl/decaprenyl-phosphate alpha-N-acetylglucosaminyl 1-phosphate transferase [Candidatus Omnitrophica bacterium]|nr:undecaprenyl/decaprenyl-phosphate alpha-N-acetylglucosaminyl 1-phosphate transferase [Candidatus Omnitrophota bacterium]
MTKLSQTYSKTFSKFIGLIVLVLCGIGISQYINTYYQHLKANLLHNLLWAIVAFCIVILSTPIIILIAKKLNIRDRNTKPSTPTEKKNIPLLGGSAIIIGLIATLILYQLRHKITFSHQFYSIIVACTIIYIMGTIDDLRPLSSVFRIFGQIGAAVIIMSTGILLSFPGTTLIGHLLSICLSLIWIIGIINTMNFADGADGLATGMTAISALFFFLIALHQNQPEIAFLSAITMGTALGFLCYNFYPAKIYLGDGGSTLLGFILAAIAIFGGWSNKGPVIALSIPVIILGVLIFDMIYITASRIINGKVHSFREWLDYRGRDHFHHRLMNMNFAERHAVGFIYLVCIILGLNALELDSSKNIFTVSSNLVHSVLTFIMITILMLVGRKRS